MALSLGTIFGTLELEDKFSKALDSAAKSPLSGLGNLGNTITGISSAFSLVSAGVNLFAGAVSGAAKAVAELAEKAERLQNKSFITGLTTDALQQLDRLAENAGSSGEAVVSAIGRMQRSLVKGGEGFKKLGLDAQSLTRMGVDKQLESVAKAITSIENPAERAAAAMEIFGRSGRELLPVLKEIADGGTALKVSLSEDQIKSLAELDNAIDASSGAFADLWEQIKAGIVEVGPDMSGFLKGTASLISDLAQKIQTASKFWGDLAKHIHEKAMEARDDVRLLLSPSTVTPESPSLGLTSRVKLAQSPMAQGAAELNLPSADEALKLMNFDDLKKGAGDLGDQLKKNNETIKLGVEAQKLMNAEIKHASDLAVMEAADHAKIQQSIMQSAVSLSVELAAEKKISDEQKKQEEQARNMAAGTTAITAGLEKQALAALKTGASTTEIESRLKNIVGITNEQVAAIMGAVTAQDKLNGKVKDEEAIRQRSKDAKFAGIMGGISAFSGMIGGGVGAALNSSAQSFSNFRDEMKDANALTDEGEKSQAKFAAKVGLTAAVVGALGDKLQNSTNPAVAKLGGALSGAAAGAKMGAAFGPWGAAVGAAAGAIFGFINKAKQMKKELVDIKNKFAESMGGMDELKRKAAEAGVSLEKMFAAKNKEALLKSIDEVKGKLQTWDDAHTKLQSAIDKYGITVEELGPKFAQQEMDKKALDLIEAWQLLAAAGVDVSVLVAKMGPEMSAFVDQSVRAGTAIPEAMRASIAALYEAGQLIHDDGTAFTEAEYNALNFSQTMTEQFQTLIEKITEMVNALLGIPNEIPVNVNVNTTHTDDGGGRRNPNNPDNPTEFAAGGVVTTPTLGLIGESGPEAVIPLSEMAAMNQGAPTTAELSPTALRSLTRALRDALLQAQ